MQTHWGAKIPIPQPYLRFANAMSFVLFFLIDDQSPKKQKTLYPYHCGRCLCGVIFIDILTKMNENQGIKAQLCWTSH